MRIIDTIEHPDLKITVFKMDDRITLKFENEGYEQTFKLGNDERLANVEAVRRLVDPEFLTAVSGQFQQMHRIRLAACTRAFPSDAAAEFETII